MASASLIISASTKKLVPTTIVPCLHNPQHKVRSPTNAPQCSKISSVALQIEDKSPVCRSIHDTLSSIHDMGRVVLIPDQMWPQGKKERKSLNTPHKRNSSSMKASSKSAREQESMSLFRTLQQLTSGKTIEQPTPAPAPTPDSPQLPPLESALARLNPRHREVVDLALNTKYSAQEIGVAMRPEKPLTPATIASYLLLALSSVSDRWEEEEALYDAIGKDRIIEIVKADYFRWTQHKGFRSNQTNAGRVRALGKRNTSRKKLRKAFEKGTIDAEQFESMNRDIQKGYAFVTMSKWQKERELTGFFERNQDFSLDS